MQIAGVCYLTNSFARLLAPPFADRIFPAILAPAFPATFAGTSGIASSRRVTMWLHRRARLQLILAVHDDLIAFGNTFGNQGNIALI